MREPAGPADDGSVPEFDFSVVPETDQSFENALAKARAGERLTVPDGIELLTTGTDSEGIDPVRKEAVLEAADRRRAAVVGEDVTFVANLNNNVTTACNTGCLFCNFKDTAHQFEAAHDGDHAGFTKTPAESRAIVDDAVEMGIYEVTSVSGLHPAFALNEEHHEILAGYGDPESEVDYKPPAVYETDPGTYVEQMRAMSVGDVHLHSMTPEEAQHARRGTEWSYEDVYRELSAAGLDSAPGTAAEILVEEVRDVICPGKISTGEWVAAMEGAIAAGLDVTATMMYGHVENEAHRVEHLKVIRDLQDRTGGITEFVPLSFIHPPLRARHRRRRRERRRGRTTRGGRAPVPRQRRERPVLVGEVRRREGAEAAQLRRERLYGDDPVRGDHHAGRRHLRRVPLLFGLRRDAVGDRPAAGRALDGLPENAATRSRRPPARAATGPARRRDAAAR